MTLTELKAAVDSAVEEAVDYGRSPDGIQVSLQIDRVDGESIWSDLRVELFYDDNLDTSGCVLTALLSESE
jgi:hypothetical protein